jgi:peptidoglycan/LPS O-acetylase OafA/YrhL
VRGLAAFRRRNKTRLIITATCLGAASFLFGLAAMMASPYGELTWLGIVTAATGTVLCIFAVILTYGLR